MQFDESKHPRDGDGKFTDKGGGEAKRVFDLAEELGVPYDRDTSYQALKARVEEAQKKEVVELSDDNELARLIASSDENKYKIIEKYLQRFVGKSFELSDGIKAEIDKTDASKLANKTDDKRVAELSEFEKLIRNAKFSHEATDIEHRKFTSFRYYEAKFKYRGENNSVWVNVGKNKYTNNWHIYALTKK